MPIYDFKTSSRIGYTTVEVPSSRIIILEGIYALNSQLRDLIDLRVSVTGEQWSLNRFVLTADQQRGMCLCCASAGGVHFDLVKRVLRDIDRSGQAPHEIIQQVSPPAIATRMKQVAIVMNPSLPGMACRFRTQSTPCTKHSLSQT